MDVEVRAAPEGTRSYWRVEADTLIIWVSKDLDELARRRYIQQAKLENNVEPRRRGRLALPLAAGGIHRAVRNHSRATTAIAGTAVASAVIASVLVPFLESDNTPARRHAPAYAAPAPHKPTSAHPRAEPRRPRSAPPSSSAPTSKPSTASTARQRIIPRLGVGATVRGVARDTLSGVRPSPPLRSVIPPPARTQTPAARRRLLERICVRVDLVTKIQVGCGGVAGAGRP